MKSFVLAERKYRKPDRIPQNPPVSRWQFSKNLGKANLINMYRIVSFVLSVPDSNAFVEKIFCLMTIKCQTQETDVAQS